MKRGKKASFSLIYQSLSRTFFYCLFLVVNFFILIGEVTKKIIVSPFNLLQIIINFGRKLFSFLINRLIFSFSKIKKSLKPKVGYKEYKTKLIKFYFWKPCRIRIIPSLIILIKKFIYYFWRRLIGLKDYLLNLISSAFNLIRQGYRIILSNISLKVRYFVFGFLASLIIIFINQAYLFVVNLPSPNNIGKVNYPLSTHIYDRNGKLLYEIFRDQNRTPVKLSELPKYIYQASIAIEDKDFYHHKGVSFISGIIRAAKDMILTKKLQGGSTITQQLVKSALLTPERTIQRKIREIILALWTERIFTKEKILEMYLNQVPYGGSAYGIEEAAKNYFGKSAKNLNLEEAALLAGLPQAPSLYSPYINPDLAVQRRNDVLTKMKEQGYIDESLKNKSQKTELTVLPPKTSIKAPHFVFFVKSALEAKYGIKEVEEGGLKVTTTLDLDIQEKAENILEEELEKIKYLNVANGGILVSRPPTGEILAMVGSVDYFASPSGAFNVTTALRQPGSAIKPIMYSLALDKGYTAASIIDDSPVVFNIAGSEPYRPVNYDNKFHGRLPLRYALANSYNVPAVKVLSTIGVENFIGQAKKMGISTWNDPSRFGLSLTLGGGEVTMIDMAEAFSIFANRGDKVDLSTVLNIENMEKGKIYQANPVKIRTIDEGIAFIISDILSDNFARQWAFGAKSSLEIPGYQVAVKTGTTNNKKDNWTIGYTPEFLVAVWVGNNDNSPMNPYLTSGITGAAPIWNRVINFVLKDYADGQKTFVKPDDVVEKICYFGKKEYFLKGTENKASCRDILFNQSPTPSPSQ